MTPKTNVTRIGITIPEGLNFEALNLSRDPVTGDIAFDWQPIEAICRASGIDVAVFRNTHEDNLAGLLTAWYSAHRANGGAPNLIQEQLLAEVDAEDSLDMYRVQSAPGKLQ